MLSLRPPCTLPHVTELPRSVSQVFAYVEDKEIVPPAIAGAAKGEPIRIGINGFGRIGEHALA